MATEEQRSSAGRRRPGLRRLSADQIGKAINETEKQVNGIMLAFIGAVAFCVLSLLTPDSALLGGSDKVNVPLAGPVSFVGFIIIGPAVLVVLRVYLQIYLEHGKRLARVARLVAAKRDPTLLSSQNDILRIAFALVLFLLLPLTLLMFAWKAAVFPAWGARLLGVAVAVTACHAILLRPPPDRRRLSWRWVLLAVSLGILAGGIPGFGAMLGFELPHRSFALLRANLSGQWLVADDLRGADLYFANLSRADLFRANLGGSHLGGANLSGAHLGSANLSRTNLFRADLSGANLDEADLGGANLDEADLSGATNLTQPQLDKACGTKVKLPPGLTLEPCPR